MKTAKVRQYILWALIGVTTLFIWGQSLLPAEQSQEQSGFVRMLLDALLGDGPVAVFILTYVRKIAHFTEFFLLGAEWAAYRRMRRCRGAWLYGLPVAAADEVLQFASPGRAPALADVALDFAGYLCGFAVVTGILWLMAQRGHRDAKKAK